jgi:uncharacterized protein YdiU (UPF0061 family)
MLADYVIDALLPALLEQEQPTPRCCRKSRAHGAPDGALAGVGFMHGVMNTDNMSILGLTLDYGPFGFMEASTRPYLQPHRPARPLLLRQPAAIGHWNCYALAQALLPLIGEVSWRRRAGRYQPVFAAKMERLLHAKLGLSHAGTCRRRPCAVRRHVRRDANASISPCSSAVERRARADTSGDEPLRDLFIDRPAFDAGPQLPRPPAHEAATMGARGRDESSQPEIRAAKLSGASGHRAPAGRVAAPRTTNSPNEHYAALPPDWASHLEVSCSS